MKMNLSHRAGYSLLEFLFAISITVSIAWITGPELSAVLRSVRLKQEAIRVEALLEEALLIASEEQHSTAILLKDRTFFLFSTPALQTTRRMLFIAPSISVVSQKKPITFYPHQVNQPARILLYQQDAFCEVIVSLRGRIRRSCS